MVIFLLSHENYIYIDYLGNFMTDINQEMLINGFLNAYCASITIFFAAAIFFTISERLPKHKCVQQAPWWLNRSIKIDILYMILNPVFKIFLRLVPVAVIFLPLLFFMKPIQIYVYLMNGSGPLRSLSPLTQSFIFVLLSDFLFYWSHRVFHTNFFWPLHAIHHGPQDVDWTTAYRFHPLNLALGPWLVTSIFILFGVSPVNIFVVAPLEVLMAFFVHSNLNITLGPLRYFISTPVFHRWHHTCILIGRSSNYGAIFSFWDVVFGTFYFPENCLPVSYGIINNEIEENFLTQMIYPFRKWYQILVFRLSVNNNK